MSFQRILRLVELWWSEWKYYVPVLANALISSIVYGYGFRMSNAARSMPLARAGALTTTISIAFTLWNYREILLKSEDIGARKYDRAIRLMRLTYQDPDVLIENFRRRLRARTKTMEDVITWMQAFLLMIATLVWGFGDLANQWMK